MRPNHLEQSSPFAVGSVKSTHDDVIKWKPFLRYWPFVRGIHRSPMNSPHKGQWRGALMFSLSCVWINGWVNNRKAGDLRRYRAHYDIMVMSVPLSIQQLPRQAVDIMNSEDLSVIIHKSTHKRHPIPISAHKPKTVNQRFRSWIPGLQMICRVWKRYNIRNDGQLRNHPKLVTVHR